MSKPVLSMVQAESGEQKIIRVYGNPCTGELDTLTKRYSLEKIHALAVSPTSANYLQGFISAHDAYEFEREALDEYPNTDLTPLKKKTQAFLHSLINHRSEDATYFDHTARKVQEELATLPRAMRRRVIVKSRRKVQLTFTGCVEGWFENEVRYVTTNGTVFMLGCLGAINEEGAYWQARELRDNPNKVGSFVSERTLANLVHWCEVVSR